MTPNLRRIPEELITRRQWVCWRPDKTPVNPKTGGNAKTDDPSTWAEFAEAAKLWEEQKDSGIAGVGYQFSSDDPYCGVDLDRCLTPESGELKFCARILIDFLASYTERSPSNTGVHIIIKGKLLREGGNQKQLNCGWRVEVYDRLRFFTVTGHHLPGTPTAIEDRQAELTLLHLEIFVPEKKEVFKSPRPSPTLALTDSQIIARAQAARNGKKFGRLWKGIWQGDYPSPSEADLALCAMLAYWVGPDPGRIDLLFRQAGLFRKDKWDRQTGKSTYGARTIEKAISRCRAFT